MFLVLDSQGQPGYQLPQNCSRWFASTSSAVTAKARSLIAICTNTWTTVRHVGQSEQDLDLERFMSYLDIEHYLGFRGSKTWSSEGNESQLMIRKAIGHVIHSRMPDPGALPDV
jgi:hypothetical protein